MSATFYYKIHRYVLSKDESLNDITIDEADAILHFLLDLIEAQSCTMGGNPNYYTKKAVKLIQHCRASITSDIGFKQSCEVYDAITIAPDEIEYRITMSPGIKINKKERYHMFGYWFYGIRTDRDFPCEIINAMFTYDERIRERDCLNTLLKHHQIEHSTKYVDMINKYLAELDDNADVNTPTKKRKT